MKIQFEAFRTSTKYWETIFREASEFASKLGQERLINISHSCDYGDSVVTVWYWGEG